MTPLLTQSLTYPLNIRSTHPLKMSFFVYQVLIPLRKSLRKRCLVGLKRSL